MKVLWTLIIAVCMLSCGKPADPVKSMKEGLETALINKNWVGKIDGQPVILTILRVDNSLSAQMQYTYFTKPGVLEDMTVHITDSGTIELTGTKHKRVAGEGGFTLDTLTGRLSSDSITISGTTRSTVGGEWSVSTKSTIEEVDPPLDITEAEAILLNGKWEGRMGQKPAVIKFSQKAGKVSAVFTFGNRSVTTGADIQDDGLILMKAQEKPTPQGLVSESFSGQITRDFMFLHGSYQHSVKQGFVEQSTGDNWIVQNIRKEP